MDKTNWASNKTDWNDKVDNFVKSCQGIINDYFQKNFSNLIPDVLSIEPGNRYIKIVRKSDHVEGRSVYCFIDKSNGDVLKAATWKAPAKHSRGNLYDDKNGVGSMGPHGAAYLR